MAQPVPPNHPPTPIGVGDVIAGKYQVESILGQGGMGVVVAAMHLDLKERFALKLLPGDTSENPEFKARFFREAQLTAKLRSEHVTRVTDVGVHEGTPFMVMEVLEGQDLRQVLRTQGALPVEVAVDYVVQACEGVAEAHLQGIVHRDLKPANLFVCKRRDGSDLVKILDFGISKSALRGSGGDPFDELTGTNTMLGSPRYMSPEQVRNSTQVDARADVWALATLLWQALTLKAPFQADTPTETIALILSSDPPPDLRAERPDVPPALQAALLRALEKDRERRTPTVADFATELVDAVAQPRPGTLLQLERIQAMLPPVATRSVSQRRVVTSEGPLPELESGDIVDVSTATSPSSVTASRGSSVSNIPPPRQSPAVYAGAALLLLSGAVIAFLLGRQSHSPGAAAVPLATPAVTAAAPLVTPAATAAAPVATAAVGAASAAVAPGPVAPSAAALQPLASAPAPSALPPTPVVAPAAPRPASTPARPGVRPRPAGATAGNPLEDRL